MAAIDEVQQFGSLTEVIARTQTPGGLENHPRCQIHPAQLLNALGSLWSIATIAGEQTGVGVCMPGAVAPRAPSDAYLPVIFARRLVFH